MNYDGTQSGENFDLLGILASLSNMDMQKFGTDINGRGENTPESWTFGMLLMDYLPAEIHPRNI